MTRAAIYARFSSDRQSERSIEDQVRLCRERADAMGLEVAEIYPDYAISGAAAVNRPALQRMMADAAAGRFSVVIAEALDRLSRNQRDTADIHERLTFYGVRIVTLSEGDVNELHVGLKGTMNALFLKDLAAKTSRGMRGNAEAGYSTGGRVYGYRALRAINPDGTQQKVRWEIDHSQAEIVRRIFREYEAGRSARQIAYGLNADRIPSPSGGIWHGSTIAGSRARASGILNNPLYVGKLPYNRQTFLKDPVTGKRVARPNPPEKWLWFDHPELRIIDQDLWDRTRAIKQALGGNQPASRRRPPSRLLSGLLFCGVCGHAMAIVGHTRHKQPKIGCSHRKETGLCSNTKTITAHRLETRVLAALKDRLLAPQVIETAAKAYQRERRRLAVTAGREIAAIDRRTAEVQKAIAGIVKAIEDGAYSPALKERLARLEQERQELEAERAAIERPGVVALHPAIGDRYRQMVEGLETELRNDPADTEARSIVRSLIDRITVHPGAGHGEIAIELVGTLAQLLEYGNSPAPAMGMLARPERAPATNFLLTILI